MRRLDLALTGCSVEQRKRWSLPARRAGVEFVSVDRLRNGDLPDVGELVFCIEALARPDPGRVVQRVRSRSIIVRVCLDGADVALAEPWLVLPAIRVITASQLEQRFGRDLPDVRRPIISIEQWERHSGTTLPEAIRPTARALFDQLRQLDAWCVNSWAALNGRSRHAFRRDVLQAFGESPSAVRTAYLLLAARHMRELGHTFAEIAEAFGYSDASTLHRAIRRG